ncbi:unnamed protein product [Vitrella brassicaformis CCMP3155]|uniref:Uncharacterized protein n=1 Tax=Vitrella brassicaformis (strain CCMP3155) TaxID=1169540 RepID=A0A0G4FIW9_VITBC|nr:unnamed protein product [Vitrella brassicaformis CCMP3155]|eukprot:CEM13707.1 unnamed protein product [Vitrella brassicaformis CCMP3155]
MEIRCRIFRYYATMRTMRSQKRKPFIPTDQPTSGKHEEPIYLTGTFPAPHQPPSSPSKSPSPSKTNSPHGAAKHEPRSSRVERPIRLPNTASSFASTAKSNQAKAATAKALSAEEPVRRRSTTPSADTISLRPDISRAWTREEKKKLREEIRALLPPDSQPMTQAAEEQQRAQERLLHTLGGLSEVYDASLLNQIAARGEEPEVTRLRLEQLAASLSNLGDLILASSADFRATVLPDHPFLSAAIVAIHHAARSALLSPQALVHSMEFLLCMGGAQTATPLSFLLHQLLPLLPSLPTADASRLLRGVARHPVLAQQPQIWDWLVTNAAEQVPEVATDGLVELMGALGEAECADVDLSRVSVMIRDLLDCGWIAQLPVRGVASVLFSVGKAGMVDGDVLDGVCAILLPLLPFVTPSEAQSLLMTLALHKSLYDNAGVVPNPIYRPAPGRLVKALTRRVTKEMEWMTLERATPLCLTVSMLGRGKDALKALVTARVLKGGLPAIQALPTGTYVTLLYSLYHMAIYKGFHPDLPLPLLEAFPAHLPKMSPRQIATSLESLKPVTAKRLAAPLLPAFYDLAQHIHWQLRGGGGEAGDVLAGRRLTPTEIISVLKIYGELKFKDRGPLCSILDTITAVVTPPPLRPLLGESSSVSAAGVLDVSVSPQPAPSPFLAKLGLPQLCDLLEVYALTKSIRTQAVLEALDRRLEASSNSISPTNLTRILCHMATLQTSFPPLVRRLCRLVADETMEAPQTDQSIQILWSLIGLDCWSTVRAIALPTVKMALDEYEDLPRQSHLLLFESLCQLRVAMPPLAHRCLTLCSNFPAVPTYSATSLPIPPQLMDTNSSTDTDQARSPLRAVDVDEALKTLSPEPSSVGGGEDVIPELTPMEEAMFGEEGEVVTGDVTTDVGDRRLPELSSLERRVEDLLSAAGGEKGVEERSASDDVSWLEDIHGLLDTFERDSGSADAEREGAQTTKPLLTDDTQQQEEVEDFGSTDETPLPAHVPPPGEDICDTFSMRHLRLGGGSGSSLLLPTGENSAMITSVLTEMQFGWRSRSKHKLATMMTPLHETVGEVLGSLNIAAVLRECPHPGGMIAQEHCRPYGGFAMLWQADHEYVIDLAHPFTKIAIVLVGNHSFGAIKDQPGDSDHLLCEAVLKMKFLHGLQGWTIIPLRKEQIRDARRAGGGSSSLHAAVGRANRRRPVSLTHLYGLEDTSAEDVSGLLKHGGGGVGWEDGLSPLHERLDRDRVVLHVASQLYDVFPMDRSFLQRYAHLTGLPSQLAGAGQQPTGEGGREGGRD